MLCKEEEVKIKCNLMDPPSRDKKVATARARTPSIVCEEASLQCWFFCLLQLCIAKAILSGASCLWL